jgi:hypothetical protein
MVAWIRDVAFLLRMNALAKGGHLQVASFFMNISTSSIAGD